MIIYYHKNLVNGKYYVGQTSRTLNERSNGGYGYRGSKKFFDDILKYGWNNFEHKVICECSKEEADELERFYIQKFDAINNGYNTTIGGVKDCDAPQVSKANKERVWEKESREKLSHSLSGIKRTQETREKISNAKKGDKNPMYGVVVPSVVIHVRCVETGIEYYSIAECERAMNLSHSHISSVIKGKRHHCGGYTFERVILK